MVPADHTLTPRVLELLPIAGLETWLQEEALQQGELVQYRKKDTVFKEGDDDADALFLIDGALELKAGDQTPTVLKAGEGDALRAVAQLRPRRYTATCVTPVTMYRIARALLDHILSDEQVSKEGTVVVEDGIGLDESGDWMSILLESELFTRLPPDHMQRFFAELEPVMVEAGDVVVEQGTPGDFLYIVAEGECTVVRKARGSAHEQELARLKTGGVFGEEALISDSPRNATVRALGDGMVMRLPKVSFEELVTKPVLRPIPYAEAEQLVAAGAQWLDVRFPEEFESGALDGAINIPLNVLRLQVGELDASRQYVTYCDTGGRASTAAFLMMRGRFDVQYLAGGLLHSPLADGSSADAPGEDQAAAQKHGKQPEEQKAASNALPQAAAPELELVGRSAAVQPADVAISTLVENPQANDAEALANAQSAELAAVNAQLNASVAQLEQERGRHERALGALREELNAIRADRDVHATRSNKAINAARDMKAKGEEAVRALNAERAQVARLKEAQTKASADAERALEMEKLRLGNELDSLQSRAESEREELRTELQKRESAHSTRLEELERQLTTLERDHAAALAELDEARTVAEEEASDAHAKVSVLEAEVSAARSRIDVLEARFEATRRTIMEQESQLQDVARQAAEREETHGTQADQERAQLLEERAVFEAEKRSLESALSERATRLEAALEAADRAQREAGEMADGLVRDREAMNTQLAEQRRELEAEFESREQALSNAEKALRDEESVWQENVANAVLEERERLERQLSDAERAKAEFAAERKAQEEHLTAQEGALNERMTALEAERRSMQYAQSEAATQAQHALTELESREQALARAQAALLEERASITEREQRLAAEQRSRAEYQLEALKATYERKLAEQAALLADERRRLENQSLRLKEALAAKAPPPPPTAPAMEEFAVRRPPAHAADTGDRGRVMSPARLAEIRQRMAAKMEAAKNS